jgi:hypothetical protein
MQSRLNQSQKFVDMESEDRRRKSEQSSLNEESNLFLTNFKQKTKINVGRAKESKG